MEPTEQPGPADDPAARFRKPQDPAAAQTPAGAPPTPPPQSLLRMLEETLTAPLRPGALFAGLALEPVPGYGPMIANFMAYWTAMLALNLLHVAIANPSALSYFAAPLMAALGAGTLAMLLILGFLWAGLLHVFVKLAGGTGGYARSYQIISMLALMGPLQALVNWFPMAWALPTLLWTYLTIVAVERLHKAPPLRTRAVFLSLGAFCLLSTWLIIGMVRRLAAPYRAARDMAAQIQELERAAAIPSQQGAASSATPGEPGKSGLDMIAGPSPSTAQGAAIDPRQAEALRQAGAKMIDSVMPMLNDPALTKNLPPEQAKQMRDLTKMLGDMQGSLNSGQPLTPQQRAAMMQKYQQMMLNMLKTMPKTAGPQNPPASAPAQTQP